MSLPLVENNSPENNSPETTPNTPEVKWSRVFGNNTTPDPAFIGTCKTLDYY